MTDTHTRTERMPVKVTSLEAATTLATWLDDPEPGGPAVSYQQAADAPTRFFLVGSPAALTEVLFFVAANQLVTDRSAFEAALSLLTRVVR